MNLCSSRGAFVSVCYFLFILFLSSGSSPVNAQQAGEEKWRFSAWIEVSEDIAVDSQGIVYASAAYDRLHAINPEGTERWHFRTGASITTAPVIAIDGTIYIGTNDALLYAINADGTEKWRFQASAALFNNPAIANDGTIYIGGSDSFFYGINPDGTQKWSFEADANARTSASVADDGTLYFITNNDSLYALNPNGTQKWRISVDTANGASPAIDPDGTIYVAAYNYLYAFNADGTEKWRVDTGTSSNSTPVVGENGHIYFGSYNNYLYAVSAEGVIQWGYRTGGDITVSPVVGDNGVIYVGSADGNFYAIEADGSLGWQFNTGSAVRSSAALANDGTLYFGTSESQVIALASSSSGLATGGWPAPGQNNQNTSNADVVAILTDFDDDGVNDDVDLDDDNDGLPDSYEHANGLNWQDATDAQLDSDADSISNLEEYNLGTDPNNADSDYDGIADNVEIANGTDPTVSSFGLWNYASEGVFNASPAISKEGVVYVGGGDNYLYAFNVDGSLLWRFRTEDNVLSTPTVGPDGTIYVGTQGFNFYALNPDGTLKWTDNFLSVFSSPAIADDGTIYVTTLTRELVALNADGGFLWAYASEAGIESSPAVASDGTIYFGGRDGMVHAVNPDGSKRWSVAVDNGYFRASSPAIDENGIIYIGSTGTGLFAINPDGSLRWEFATEEAVYSSPVIDFDGTIYVGSHDDHLYAINPDGSEKWRFKTGDDVYSSPTIGGDGIIYFGSRDFDLYGVNRDGEQVFRYQTQGLINASPILVSNTLYFGSLDNSFYAVKVPSKELANTVWPKFGHNNQNTGNPNVASVVITDYVDFDYDGDRVADIAVRRPSAAIQFVKNADDGEIQRISFGRQLEDIPLVGDFDGDDIADVAVRRPSDQSWYIKNSSGIDLITGNSDGITRRTFGLQSDDIPVPADYDGDGITDLAVRRPSSFTWFILNSSGVDALTGHADGITRFTFGRNAEDIPVPADYDGDGKADIAVRRPSTQYWYIHNSAGVDLISGNEDGITRTRFGAQESDIPVPADFDGDGKADLAVRRPATAYWYVLNSSGTNFNSDNGDGIQRVRFGLQEADIPVVADYDGDGIADFAVRRPATQYQYILNSSGIDQFTGNSDGITRLNFGKQETDIPIAAPISVKMNMAAEASE